MALASPKYTMNYLFWHTTCEHRVLSCNECKFLKKKFINKVWSGIFAARTFACTRF